ncbi:hypothetical protein [uncultured Agrobacterium sp.]|uniref:hypothetical protein n=1 Tax=uncultured Agrobacterium sp. TaxID=157277 RepID=UPI002590431A|nr:hypothetical protein [uncultured Agrobacterium sp.]
MKTKETLIAAREIIASNWTDKGRAVNSNGDIVLPWDESAVAWDSTGAIYKALACDFGADFPIMELQKQFDLDLSVVDEYLGKGEVLSGYDRAIESLSVE